MQNVNQIVDSSLHKAAYIIESTESVKKRIHYQAHHHHIDEEFEFLALKTSLCFLLETTNQKFKDLLTLQAL